MRKRKEYYWIGRFICLLGYLFFALSAIVDPWAPTDMDLRKDGEFYMLLRYWFVLIPFGLLMMAIAIKKKSTYICAIVTILICGLLVFSDLAGGASGESGAAVTVFVTLTSSLEDMSEFFLYALTGTLYVGVAIVAAVRALRVKALKKPAIIVGIVTLVVCVFYIVSMGGIEDQSELFRPMRRAIEQWRDADYLNRDKIILKICEGVYALTALLALADIVLETIADRRTNETMR